MANKHTRKEHISYRRKREAAVKEQNRKHLTRKQKIQLWSVIGAVALVALLLAAFVTPKGAEMTWFGTPMFTAKDAMLAKVGNYYYDVGTWNGELEGFTQNEDYSISRDPNKFEAYYVNNDETAKVNNVYVGVVPEATVDYMYERVSAFVENMSELKEYDDGEHKGKYFFTKSYLTEEEGKGSASLVCYLETGADVLVHISISSATVVENELPTEEELYAVLPLVMENLTIK